MVFSFLRSALPKSTASPSAFTQGATDFANRIKLGAQIAEADRLENFRRLQQNIGVPQFNQNPFGDPISTGIQQLPPNPIMAKDVGLRNTQPLGFGYGGDANTSDVVEDFSINPPVTNNNLPSAMTMQGAGTTTMDINSEFPVVDITDNPRPKGAAIGTPEYSVWSTEESKRNEVNRTINRLNYNKRDNKDVTATLKSKEFKAFMYAYPDRLSQLQADPVGFAKRFSEARKSQAGLTTTQKVTTNNKGRQVTSGPSKGVTDTGLKTTRKDSDKILNTVDPKIRAELDKQITPGAYSGPLDFDKDSEINKALASNSSSDKANIMTKLVENPEKINFNFQQGLITRNIIAQTIRNMQLSGMTTGNEYVENILKLRDIDSSLYLMQAQGANYQFQVTGNPDRLNAVLSAFTGGALRIQPRSDGLFDFIRPDGSPVPGFQAMDAATTSSRARLYFDNAYRKSVEASAAERAKTLLKQKGDQIIQGMKNVSDLDVAKLGYAEAVKVQDLKNKADFVAKQLQGNIELRNKLMGQSQQARLDILKEHFKGLAFKVIAHESRLYVSQNGMVQALEPMNVTEKVDGITTDTTQLKGLGNPVNVFGNQTTPNTGTFNFGYGTQTGNN